MLQTMHSTSLAKAKPTENTIAAVLSSMDSVGKSVQLDVVELLKQVLQWTPLYKPGLNTGLIQAAKIGSAGCVKVLLSAGAEVDAEDENGDTAFVHAFNNQHCEVMEVLHGAGACTEIAKMSAALATRDPAFIRLCQQLEVPVENEDWNTCSEEVSLLLSELKLDPFQSQYGNHGYEDSPFMYLTQEGPPAVLSLMLDSHPCPHKYSAEARQTRVNAALMKAIRHRRRDNATLLLETYSADPAALDSLGRPAFLQACETDESIAQYLMQRGCDVTDTDHEGLTALHWVSCVGFTDLCSTLLTKQADVNAQYRADLNQQTPEGWTALHVAVWAVAPDIVQLLLQHGADPDCEANTLSHNGDIVPGSSPLHICIALDSLRMTRHLLDAGCDVTRPGLVYTAADGAARRLTPLQHCLTSRAWDLYELLLAAGSPQDQLADWLREDGLHPGVCRARAPRMRRLLREARPLPLRRLAAVRVRAQLGRRLVGKVDTLGVTEALRRLILLQDCPRAVPDVASSFEV